MDDMAPPDPQGEGSMKRKPHILPPVPPPPSWREEYAALQDVEGDLGVSLWRALRNVSIWSQTHPEKRNRLFNPPSAETQANVANACVMAPSLLDAFGTFVALLRDPGQISTRRVSQACRQVYEWAEAQSMLPTAVHFSEAASLLDQMNPTLANDAGQMCRRAALYDRGLIWYQRGYGLAVRMRHTDPPVSRRESIRALLGCGILYQFLGLHDKAKEQYERAAARAIRFGRNKLAAEAYHDLMTWAAEREDYSTAIEYMSLAMELYPLRHARVPHFVHDYAFILARLQHFSLALPVLQELLPCVARAEERLLVLAQIARAASTVRRVELFEQAEAESIRLIHRHMGEYVPAALIYLAEGRRVLGDWDQAQYHATHAVHAASARSQALQERDALELVARIKAREPGPLDTPPENPQRVQRLTSRLLSRLRKWKPQAPESLGLSIG